jgi:formamidopyrimidine-DNA glycosylase
MPELPEVETMVRGIRPVAEGRVVAGVVACPCACRPLTVSPSIRVMSQKAAGRTVVEVRRRAKRVMLRLDDGRAFVIEPRMTGLMLVANPPDPEHLRVEWRFEARSGSKQRSTADAVNGDSIWFWDRRGLGTVRLLERDEVDELLGEGRLGPDALEMTTERWIALFQNVDRPVKVALLDQKLVAGIGNLYASEILHQARVHPEKRTGRLTEAMVTRIATATAAILEEAIRYEGSTLGDGTYRNVLNQDGGYQNAHRVYDREGEVCPTCGDCVIERIVQAQRSTFFCPACQQKQGRR